MAMITAALLDRWPSDYSIVRPQEAGLNHDCYVRWKVFTLPNSLIIKSIGTLADEDRDALTARVQTIFAGESGQVTNSV